MIIDAHAHYTSVPPELQAYRGRQVMNLRQPPRPRQLGLVLQQPHPEREPQRSESHRRLGALFITRLTAGGPGG